MTVLKIIFILGASFVYVLPSEGAMTDWFKLNDEFKSKLNSQAILKTTRFYAQGTTFSEQQKLTAQEFEQILLKNNYRTRQSAQQLQENDYQVLTAEECQKFISTDHSHLENINCLTWKNFNSQTFLIVLYNEVIQKMIELDPYKEITSAAINPLLVAQFRDQKPIMQDEKKLPSFPVQCLNSVIAIEDNDFLDHSGVSYTGILRAFVKNIVTLRKAQGGSTITQQLVKNYFLTPEKTLTRKAKEIYMATKLEAEWTKDEILETYLNIIYMGQNGSYQVHGFPAASQYYFNKPIEQLNLSECALLAAIINNPGMNNPWKKAEKSQTRRNLVLKKMLELNLVSENEYTTALQQKLPAEPKTLAAETAPYFFEAVLQQAKRLNIDPAGTSFFTTLNLEQQDAAQKILQNGIKNLTENKKKLKAQKENGQELEGVILSADSKNGFVSTLVGGQSFKKTQFNRALNSQRQIGSLAKPFVYLSGLIYGLENHQKPTPETILPDKPLQWLLENKKMWSPTNYDKKFRGDVPYYYALKESLNSPTAFVAQQVGLENLKSVFNLYQLAVTELNPSMSLGASQHRPIDVLQAYLTISQFGNEVPLTFFYKAINDENEVIYNHDPKSNQITPAVETAILVGMMKETTQSGTAKYVTQSGFKFPSAGKTGTTSNGNDVWFAGFTPYQTTVVWLGFDQNTSTHLTGASGAVPLWTEFMKKTHQNKIEKDFSWPEGVEQKSFENKLQNEKVELIYIK